MIIPYLIDTLLADTIKALPFVERYGGVVQTLTSKQIGQGNKTKIKKYPVSCSVTEKDCNDTTLYSELVPDQSKKSIVYWELTSPMQSVGETPNLSQFTKKRFRGTARLVVWLNLQELGHKEIDTNVPICQGASYTVPSVFKAISKNGNILGGHYAGNRVQIEPNRVITDLNNIFGKYDYPDDLNYYLYPFTFYAVDVTFTMDMCLDNDFEFPIFDPIKCIDYSSTMNKNVLPTENLFINLDPALGINSGNPIEGESVFLIADQSGNNNDFGQPSGSFQTTWISDGVNGLPSLRFGTLSYILKTGLDFATDEVSIFIAFERKGNAFSGYSCPYMLSVDSFTVSGNFIQINDIGTTYNFNTPNNDLDESLTLKSNDIFVFGIVKSSTQIEYFVNGVSIGAKIGALSLTGLNHYIGAWNTNFSNMDLGQFVMYKGVKSGLELQAVNDYFTNKFLL